MCDTIVALGNSTSDGSVIFGKNSDREPNEAQEILQIPAARHLPDEKVQCTYIEIPQVEETYQVLLSKPFWMWGAEMGTNQFGVTIGNEAVFTRTPYGKEPGLIGMDMLRLALERSVNASSALKTIIDLLERYGQSGNCGFAHKLYYHNSFLICDPEEAWVLETSGKEWAAEKVQTIRSISNAITIGDHWDLASENLVNNAIKNGRCKDAKDFSFSRCYSDLIYTTFSDARNRQSCTTQAILQARGKIDAATMIRVLGSHENTEPEFTPGKGITGADVCCHAGWGPIRSSQTVGSLVSVLRKDCEPIHWITGTAAPCTSVFRPVWMDAGLPEHGSTPTGTYDEAALFWRHETLHREILRDYATRLPVARSILDKAQEDMMNLVDANYGGSAKQRRDASIQSFELAEKAEKESLEKIKTISPRNRPGPLYSAAWNTFNREAGMRME
jgi:dipeptidase